MRKPKLLLVDDRPENLLTLESLLEGPGVEIVRAESGQDALAAILDSEFALVLLDVQMPDMDGYEVAELMRGNSATRNIPIIFVTAERIEKAHMFKGYDAGAVDFLVKPLEPTVLKGKVSIFLEMYHQREELRDKTAELDRRLVELEELQQQLEETNEQLRLLSSLDGLTGLLNRRRFDEILEEEWQRCMRDRKQLSVLLIDIDHFKTYNDTYGHIAGDEALKMVGRVLSESLHRKIDRVARFGGEEFVVILPGTDAQGAKQVAERMRNAVMQTNVRHERSSTADFLTISIGGGTITPKADMQIVTLVEMADAALYVSKEAGRNMSTVRGM